MHRTLLTLFITTASAFCDPAPLPLPDAAPFHLFDSAGTRVDLRRNGLGSTTLGQHGFTLSRADRAVSLQPGDSWSIPISQTAETIQLLHAVVPGSAVAAYRLADQNARSSIGTTDATTRAGSLEDGERPVERPILARATLTWSDGGQTTVNIRYQEGIGAVIRPWWHPVEQHPSDMAHARLLWSTPLAPAGHEVAALHAMTIPNPRPGVAITNLTIRYEAADQGGRYLLWGVTVDDAPGPGATRFVAPWGSDSNNGTWNSPWATLAHAAATITGGDRVYLRAGTWQPTSRIAFRNLVAPEGRQTLISNWPGDRAVFDFINTLWDLSPTREKLGQEARPHDQSMLIAFRCTRFTFNGIELVRSRGRGIGSESGTDCTLSHNTVYMTYGPGLRFATGTTRSGGRITGNRVIRTASRTMSPALDGGVGGYVNSSGRWVHLNVDGNETDICPMEAIDIGSGSLFRVDHNEIAWSDKELMLLDGTISDVEVDHNYVHDALKSPNIAGIGPNGYGPQDRIEVHHNIAHHCGFAYTCGTEGGNGGARDISIHHNIAWDCRWGLAGFGPKLNDVGDSSSIDRIQVVHNTYWVSPQNTYSQSSNGIVLNLARGDSTATLTNVLVANNILMLNESNVSWGPPTIKVDGELPTTGLSESVVIRNNVSNYWRTSSGFLPSQFSPQAVAQFVDPASWLFQLAPGVISRTAGILLTNTLQVDPSENPSYAGALVPLTLPELSQPSLVYEGFHYPTSVTVGSSLDGGQGWAEPWEDNGSGPTVSAGLVHPDIASTGGALRQTSNLQARDINTASLGIGSGDVLWSSVLVQADAPTANMRLRIMSVGGGSSSSGWGFDLTADNDIRAIASDGGSGTLAPLTTAGRPNLIVMRFDPATRTVDLWSNPADVSSEAMLGPPHSTATATSLDVIYSPSTAANANAGIYFRGDSASRPVIFDEFRLDKSFSRAVLTATAPSAYGTWVRSHGLKGAQVEPTASPANDGIDNLLKYALGADPGTPGLQGRVRHETVNIDGSRLLSLTFETPDPPPADILYRVETSSDLMNWSSAEAQPVSYLANPDGTMSATFRDSITDPPEKRRFIRLHVQGPPSP